MELRQLKYFEAAAETLSFTEAAKKCFVTQAAMSQQIKQLENELGIRLFDRRNNVLGLTKAGEKLLTNAKNILNCVEKTEEEMKHFKNESRRELRIGYSNNEFGVSWLEMVGTFVEECPDVYVRLFEVEQPDLIYQLQKGDLDVILGYPGDLLGEEEWVKRAKVHEVKYNLIAEVGKYKADPGDEVILTEEYPITVITSSDLTWKKLQSFFQKQIPNIAEEVTRYREVDLSVFPDVFIGKRVVIVPECLNGSFKTLNRYKIKGLDIETSAELIWDTENKNEAIPLLVNSCQKYFSFFSYANI